MHMIVLTASEVAAETTLDTATVAMLVSTLIPLVVSVITKKTASDGLKAIVNIFATALVAVVALWLVPSPGVNIGWVTIVNTLVGSVVASLVAYKGLWKPTGITETLATKTGDFGIGHPSLQTVEGEVLERHDEGNDLNYEAEVPENNNGPERGI